MYNIWKRSLAMLLAVVMVVGQVPVSAFANDDIVEEIVYEEEFVQEEVVEEEVVEEEVVEEDTSEEDVVVEEEIVEEEIVEDEPVVDEEPSEDDEATEKKDEAIIDIVVTDDVAAAVVAETAVAMIGDQSYDSVQAAINAAQDGDTVTIGAGEIGPINISNKNITIEGTVDADGELLTTIKGGNPAITGHGFNGTIKDLKIVDAWTVMYAEPAGNVTVDNVYVTGATYGFHLIAYSTGLTWKIQNSYMDLSWANSFGVYGAGDAAIVIKGNEFVSTSPYYPDAGANHVNSFLPNVTITENIFGENAKILIRPAVTDTSKVIIAENYHADLDNVFADGGADVKIESYYAAAEDVGDTQKLIVMPKGTVTYGFVGQDCIWGEATSNTKESLVVKLYEGETEIATATLSEAHFGNQADGSTYVTWSIPFVPYENNSWSWTWAEGYPSCDMAPTAVKLYSDGAHVATNEVQFNGPDNIMKIVAMVGDKDGKVIGAYTSLEDLPDNAATIVLKSNVTGDVTMPAGATLVGNGYAINGTLTAGGDLTFVGHTKATGFSAGYYNRTITIGEGACLEITGTGRVTLGYGNTFNITGSIADAKTADKANVQPSLIIPGGMSITGGNDAAMNVTNAYVSIGSTSSKNNAANGIFDLKFTNSIVDFTDQFTLAEPTGGKNPTFRVSFENSVVTTATKLCVAASNSTVDVKNSTVTLGTYLRNSGKLNLTEGSVLTGSMIQFGENGGNDGTITVDASTLTIKNSSAGHAMDGNGTGKVIVANGGSAEFDHVIETAVTVDTESSLNVTGSIKTGTITVDAEKYDGKSEVKINLGTATDMTVNTVNSDDVKAKLDANGKFVLAGPTATIGDKNYFDLQTAVNAAEEEDMIVMANDEILTAPVVIGEDKWFTLDLNGKSITAEGITAFQVAGDMTIKGNGTVTAATIAENNGWLTVENGTYEGTAALFTGTGKTYLTGGNFTGDVGTVEAAGGTYDRVVADENLADDYGCVERDGKFVVEKVKAVATIMRGKITTHYATLAEAIAAAKNSGDTITMNGHHYVGKLNVAKNVTIDLNGYTLHMTQGDSKFSGNVTIENGTIDITGLNVSADAIFNIYGDMTLNNVNVIGDGYSSAFAVFYVRGENALEINDSSIVLANDSSSAGGVFKAELNSVGKFTINNTVVELENVVRGAVNADLVLNGAELTITGGDNGINGGKLTATDSEITITGGTGRGLTIADANASLTGTTMTLSDNGEGDILFKNELALSYDNTSVVNAAEVRSNVKNAKINDEVVTATSAEPGSIVDSDYTNPDWNVQLGEDDFFMTLQEAVNAAAAGDNEIVLLKDYTEDVTISQVEGINIIIDGDGNEYSGTIHLDGNSRHTGTETLTIQNINFITEETDHDFIELDSAAEAVRYAHNVTVKDSTFTAPEGANSVVGMRYRQCYNMVVENVEANNLFLLMWTDGGNNLTVSGAEINTGSNTIAEGGFSVGTEKNISITGTEISGGLYGVRLDADNAGTSATIGGNIDSTIPVLVRYAKADYAVNVADGTVLNGSLYDIAVVGGNATNVDHINDNNAVTVIPEIKGADNATKFIAKPLIYIGNQGYATLQAAVDAASAMTGNVTIHLNGAVAGDATIVQKEGVNITIDGAREDADNSTFDGTITIHGQARYNGSETLTFQNIDFVTSDASRYFIDSNSTASAERYAHNVTVQGCTFTAVEGSAAVDTAVAMRIRQGFNITVDDVDATGLHSLLQGYGIAGVTVDEATVTGKNGISLGTSTGAMITNTTINAEGEYGYGVRMDGGAETETKIDNITVEAFVPVLLRDVTKAYEVTVTGDNNNFAPKNENGYVFVAVGGDVDQPEDISKSNSVAVIPEVNGLEDSQIFIADPKVSIGNIGYSTLAEAVEAATAGAVININSDLEYTEVVAIDKSVTINGNGHKITSSASRVFRVVSSDVKVEIKELDIVHTGVRFGTNDIRGISIDPSLKNVDLTLNDCSIKFADGSANDWSYAVNVSGSGTGHKVTVNGGTYEGANVINVHGANNTIVVKDATLNSLYPLNDMYYGATIWVLQKQGSTVEATGNTFNGDNAIAFNLGTGTSLAESNNEDNTKFVMAKAGETYYYSLAEAVEAVADGAVIRLLQSVSGAGVVIDKNITIDFNGKTYTVDKCVGSTGTETLGFQILAGNKVELKNGTLAAAAATVEGNPVKMLVQNYADLTLTDMTLDGTKSAEMQYVLSNNSGEINVTGNTNIIAAGKAVAFDVYDYSSAGYTVPKMYINTTGKITGKIEVSETATLAISGGTFTAEIEEAWCAEGFIPMKNADGTYGVKNSFFAVRIGEKGYETFTDALDAVADGQTITILNVESKRELNSEYEFTKDIEFTITGKAPNYALPVVTFTNATVNIEDAEILIPELDARQNATINVIDSIVHGDGDDEIVKSYYNGAINVSGKSVIHTMQVTTMGYITISGEAVVNATTGINVFGNGLITVKDKAVLNAASLQLTAKDYSGRDNTDADRVGKPAQITVDGATFVVGKVYSEGGSDYSYNSKYGINVGTIAGKSAILDIKNGATVEIYMAKGETTKVGADGTVNVADSTFTVANRSADGTVTLENKGAFNVSGESTLNIATLTGENIDLMDGAIVKDSTIGGEVFVAGKVIFRGDNTVNMLYDYGTLTDYYGTTANMEWTVEEGASLTVINEARYGLGYGDSITIVGQLENGEALTGREGLKNIKKSFFAHGLVAQESKGWNCKSSMIVKNAFVEIGSNNSFGNKPGNYGGEYTISFENAIVNSSRITFYEALSTTNFTMNGTDALVGTFMTRDKDSTFTLTNSKLVSTTATNGNDEGNYHAGTLTLIDSDLTYSASLVVEGGTISIDAASKLTAPSIEGNGKLIIDATGMNAGPLVTVDADATNYAGEIEVINNPAVRAEIIAGKIFLLANEVKIVHADNTATGYQTLEAAIAAAQDGDVIVLLDDLTRSEVILIDKDVKIDGDGHKITSSATRVIRVTKADVEVEINNLNMVSEAVRVGTNDIRGISIDIVNNITLTLNNCSVDFTDASANDWAYAVNVTGGNNHKVTVNGGTYEGANVINVRGSNQEIVVKDATLNSLYPLNDVYYGATIWVLQNQGSEVEATGNTFNGDNAIAFNLGTGTQLTESNNEDNTKLVIAKAGETYYYSLAEAVAAVADGAEIELLHSVSGAGVVIDKNITINFNRKTYTVDKCVGSTGTETLGFQILAGKNVTLKNGTLAAAADTVEGNPVKMLVQNYANLTLTNMNLDGTGSAEMQYVLSNNSGTTYLNGETFIKAPEGAVAFDVYDYTAGGYALPVVNVNTYGTITGKIEVSETATLAISGGTFTAEIEEAWCAEGFIPVDNGNGTYGVKEGVFVAHIGEVGYEDLNDAFAAAVNGDEIEINVADTYALKTSGKNIIITGMVEGVVFDNIGAHNMGGADVTFNNVTFDYYPNVNYTGLQHAGNLVYNDCIINGQVFLYGESETFNRCIFNQNSADAYNVWTYGAKEVEFNNCEFNSVGKSVLIYNEHANVFNKVDVKDSTFNASAPVDGKAAIEMDSSLTGGIELNITGSTATGFDKGNVSGNELWNNKKGTEGVNNDITVAVENEVVLEPVYAAKIGDLYYTSLQAAVNAAKDNDQIDVLMDVEDATTIDKAVIITATGHAVSGDLTVKANATIIANELTDSISGNVTVAEGAVLNINGGNFIGTVTGDINVSGGTFNRALTQDDCAEGYYPTQKTAQTYGVTDIAVAQNGNMYFGTLKAAVNLAKAGDTIKLLMDTTAKEVVVNEQINLDLNGKTLSANESIVVKSELTIDTEGEIKANCNIFYVDGGKLNIANGVYTTNGCIIATNGGEAYVTGGIFATGNNYPFSGSGIKTTGGIFQSAPKGEHLENGYETKEIRDGEFQSWSQVHMREDDIIVINGQNKYFNWTTAKEAIERDNGRVKTIKQLAHLYDIEVTIPEGATYDASDFIIGGESKITLRKGATLMNVGAESSVEIKAAAGCILVENNGVYTAEAAKAQIGENYFESLAEALKNAVSGDEIILLDNDTEEHTVTMALTVKKNNYTANIKAGEGFEVEETAEAYVVKKVVSIGTISLYQATLELESIVYLNIYSSVTGFEGIDLTEKMGLLVWTGDEDAYAEDAFVVGNENTVAYHGAKQNGSYYGVKTDGIAAKELGDEHYMRVYVELEDGSYVYSKVTNYGPQKYAMAVLGSDAYPDTLKKTLVAMLDYAAAAQMEFGYRTDDLANAIDEQYLNAYRTEFSADMLEAVVTADASVVGDWVRDRENCPDVIATLILEGIITNNYRMAYKPDIMSKTETAKFLFWNEGTYRDLLAAGETFSEANADEVKVVGKDVDGNYQAGYDKTAAKNLGDTHYVCAIVTTSDGETYNSGVISFSAHAYVNMNLSSSDAELVHLMKCMTVYGNAAKHYFG